MKRAIMIALITWMPILDALNPPCTIEVQSIWQPTICKTHDVSLVAIKSITFKKRIKNPVKLNTIELQWQGPSIKSLCGSLYRKHPSKKFQAIEENVVSDGDWDAKKQCIHFKFNTAETIGPNSIFYLVLRLNDNLASLLQKGSFKINCDSLPPILQTSVIL